jgi:hypothetical protein
LRIQICEEKEGSKICCTENTRIQRNKEIEIMKNLKSFEDINEARVNEIAMKFTKSTAGMIPANKKAEFKADVKIKKADWDAMFTKVNALPTAKRAEIIKKLHQLGLM